MNNLTILFFIFNIIGSIAFMISGAVAAAAAEMDIGGMILVSMIAGVGGGTLRGLLLNQPIFWMQQNWYIYLAVAVAIITFFAYRFISKKQTLFVVSIFDALGLAPFMATGVSAALAANKTNLVAIAIGIVSCVGGGVMRDILCNKVPIVFQKHLYITPVFVGAVCYIIINYLLGSYYAIIISSIILLVLRFFAIGFSLNAPRPVKN